MALYILHILCSKFIIKIAPTNTGAIRKTKTQNNKILKVHKARSVEKRGKRKNFVTLLSSTRFERTCSASISMDVISFCKLFI